MKVFPFLVSFIFFKYCFFLNVNFKQECCRRTNSKNLDDLELNSKISKKPEKNSPKNLENKTLYLSGGFKIKNKENINKTASKEGDSPPSFISKSSTLLKIYPSFDCPSLFLNMRNIIIDKNGLQNNQKTKKKTITLFGLEKDSDILFNSNNSKVLKKIILSNSITKQKINKPIPLFFIDYDVNLNSFILKSLSKEIYFSVVIDSEKKFYLQYGNFYYMKIGRIIIIIGINMNKKEIKITIKQNIEIAEEKIFNFAHKDLPITIGRSNCTVNIVNSSVSKFHASINFDEKKGEYYFIDKKSTNGTQLLLNEDKIIEIKGKLHFFIGDKSFTIEKVDIK